MFRNKSYPSFLGKCLGKMTVLHSPRLVWEAWSCSHNVNLIPIIFNKNYISEADNGGVSAWLRSNPTGILRAKLTHLQLYDKTGARHYRYELKINVQTFQFEGLDIRKYFHFTISFHCTNACYWLF